MSASAAILRHLRRQLGTPASDADLLRAYAQRRDEDAFRTLVERHGPMILGICRGRLGRGRKRLADRLRRRGFGPDAAARALLVAAAGAVAVPVDLLARTVAFAAAPWSTTLPATVLVLAATAAPSKLLPASALVVL